MDIFSVFDSYQKQEQTLGSCQDGFLGLITMVLTKEHKTRFWYKLQKFYLPVLYWHFHENQLVF